VLPALKELEAQGEKCGMQKYGAVVLTARDNENTFHFMVAAPHLEAVSIL
jgi:hypothetical protein